MDETASESRVVTLASPQYLGNEQVVRRVSLHKVVEAFLALKYGKGHEVKQGFSRLLNCFFPDTQLSVAWLEDRNGEKMPLLTEDQALLLARCNTPKLIRAGLARLSVRQKLDSCEKLGLSPVAATALLQDLGTVTHDRLEAELGPRGAFCRHAKKFQKCVRALMQQGNSGAHFLGLLDVYAPSNAQDVSQPPILCPPSKLGCVDDVASTNSGRARTLSGEELASQLIQWLKLLPVGTFLADCPTTERQARAKASAYVDFRLTTQEALLDLFQ